MTSRRSRISPLKEAENWCHLKKDQEGFQTKFINKCIGSGLFTTTPFAKGSFLLEYRGVVSRSAEYDREDACVDNSYVFHFSHNGVDYRIDASSHDSCLARWINDSSKPNSVMKKMGFNGSRHLCLFALEDLGRNTELRYNYGAQNLPWRQKIWKEAHADCSCSSCGPSDSKHVRQAELYPTSSDVEKPQEALLKEGSDSDCVPFSADCDLSCSSGGPSTSEQVRQTDLYPTSSDVEKPQEALLKEGSDSDCVPSSADCDLSCSSGGPSASKHVRQADLYPTSSDVEKPQEALLKEGSDSDCVPSSADCDLSCSSGGPSASKHVCQTDLYPTSSDVEKPQEALLKEGSDSDCVPSSADCDLSCSSGGPSTSEHVRQADLYLTSSDVEKPQEALLKEHSDTDSEYVPSSSDEGSVSLDGRPPSPILHIPQRNQWRHDEPCSSTVNSSTDVEVLTTKNVAGKRHYDKPQFCPFCLSEQKKLPRHLATHNDESEVKAWLNTTDEQEKKKKLALMRNYGNFLHNSSVLQKGTGKLIVVYRPKYYVNPEDYLPCQHCYGYFAKSDLWKHKCSQRPVEDGSDEPSSKKIKRTLHCKPGRMLLPCSSGICDRTNEILATMHCDIVSRLVKSDKLIKMFAEKLTMKHGHRRDQEGYIRQRLREVARMVLEFRTLTGETDATLTSVICPRKFEAVTQATRIAAGFNTETNLYCTPSLALKIGHSVKTCCEILRGEALISGDESLEKQCKSFLALYSTQWEDKISHHVFRSLQEAKRNNPKLLPLTEDVVKISKYLKTESKLREQVLTNAKGSAEIRKAWASLAEVILTHVIIFNRKRPGEVSKMTLLDYGKCTNGESTIVDGALTVWEKTLSRVLWRVEIIGKRSRTVAVLLTGGMKQALDLLTCKRSEAGIDKNNIYLFAARYGEGHLRGTDTVRQHADLCKAKHPSYLRATRLRKHIATVSQIMNLQDNELDILASFLGHDIRTHRQYYRLPESTLQVAKVSKVLLKMEKGNIQSLAGKSLQDVQLNPDEEYDTDAESDIGSDQSDVEQSDAEQSDAEQPSTSTGNSHKKGVSDKQEPKAKQAWNSREKAAVAKHLGGYLQSRTVPGKAAIMGLFKAEKKTFSNRSWKNVKDFIRNQTRKKDPMGFLKT